jgi:putative lipoprotein
MRYKMLGLLAAGLLGGCTAMPEKAQLAGTAQYRDRMALPDNAVFDVTLEDIGAADAPSAVLGAQEIDPAGQPPIAFAIPYDPARIDPARRYALRATISVEDQPLFATQGDHLVLTQGAAPTAELMLEPVGGGMAGSGTPAALAGPDWRLTALNGQPVAVPAAERAPYLTFSANDGRFAGSGGCNRIAGGYEAITGGSLSFGDVISTRMACPDEGTPSEQAFLSALSEVDAYAIRDGVLHLTGDGVAMTFEQRRR